MMIEKHFINLTNGLEWLDRLPPGTPYSFLRIESTTLERQGLWRLLSELDANFLMSLALGHDCYVYDCGCRRLNSKTITVGLPLITGHLTRIWTDKRVALLTEEARVVGRRCRYYRRYFQGTIRLSGRSFATEHDGDREFYRTLALRHGLSHELHSF